MHVAFIATPDLAYVSGSSLSLRYTVEALGRQGIRCTVLCQRAPVAPAAVNVRYVELPMPLDYQVITDTTPSSSDLADCLAQLLNGVVALGDVDLVHAIYGTHTGAAAVLAGALLEVPVVISTFGRDLTLGAQVDDRYRALMEISYGRADLVVAADAESAETVREHYAGGSTRVRQLPVGMNFGMLRDIAASAQRQRVPPPRILAVQSSFNEQKGLGILLAALAEVAVEIPDVELVVAGHDDTPDGRNQARLEKQATDLGILHRVDFVGHLEHREVAELMARCDVLVDPRLINSFSSCLYEAMTMNLVVVASDQPCNRDALDDGTNGVLVRTGDPSDLAGALKTVLLDRDLASRLRTAGAARVDHVASKSDCEVAAQQLRSAYAELITARTGAATTARSASS